MESSRTRSDYGLAIEPTPLPIYSPLIAAVRRAEYEGLHGIEIASDEQRKARAVRAGAAIESVRAQPNRLKQFTPRTG